MIVIEKYFKSIFPILRKTSPKRYVLEGTATLISHNNFKFIVTATHVLRSPEDDSELFLSTPDHGAISLQATKLETINDFSDLDITFFPLITSPHLAKILTNYNFIPINKILEPKAFCRSHLMTFGFPHNSVSYIKEEEESFEAKPLLYIANESDEKIYEKYNKETDKFIIINYAKRIFHAQYNESGKLASKAEKRDSSTPRGTSGGGLFRIFIDDEDQIISCALEGVIIELKGKQYLVATRRDFLAKFLSEKFAIIETTNSLPTKTYTST